jgi:hypothetical protein
MHMLAHSRGVLTSRLSSTAWRTPQLVRSIADSTFSVDLPHIGGYLSG